jgi:AsmA protein
MAKKNLVLLAIAVVVAATFAAVMLAAPVLTAALTARIATKSGLKTHLGSAQVDLWPNLRIKVRDLQLADPNNPSQGLVFSAEELSFGVSYATLLGGMVTIEDVSMLHPLLRLREARHITGSADSTVPSRTRNFALSGPLTITDGVLIDENARRHAAGRVERIDLRAERTNDGAYALSLSAHFGGMPIRADARFASANDLFAGRPTNIKVVASAVSQPSDALNIQATLQATGTRIVFADVVGHWRNGNLNADGVVRVDTDVPRIDANLHLGRLDLDSVSLAQGNSPGGAGRNFPPLNETAVDPSFLRLFDGTFDIRADDVLAHGLRLNNLIVQTTLDTGVLRAALDSAELYHGKASGTAVLDATRDLATETAKFTLAGVKVAPLLADLADIKFFDGTLQMSLDLTSSGNSPKAAVANLTGHADISIKDGIVTGHQMPELFRQIAPYLPSAWRDLNDKIAIEALTASFAVAHGTATTQDVHIVSPVADIAGKGTIDLANRTFDLRFDPKLVTGSDAGSHPPNTLDLGAAILVHGPWSEPKVSADVSDLVNNPRKALGKLQSLGQQFLRTPEKSSQVETDDIMKGVSSFLKGLTDR